MQSVGKKSVGGRSRREFLKSTSALVAGATLGSAIAARSYAGEDNTIKIALVGCGGRGTGAAANALSTKGPTKLWAMADVFPDRMDSSYKNLSKKFNKQVEVPDERKFLGLDAYKKAIDALGPNDVVLLTTPPAFRPLHVEYAVEKGRNVFMEKAFAVDGPGIRRILKAGELATQKNLKVAGGLMSRHSQSLETIINKIHGGAIGDVVTCWAYREHGPVGYRERVAGESELAHQIRNYSCFTWVNGSFILDWLIHNIDVCCWVMNGWPVSAQGQGGRQARTQPDQLFDHYACEFHFANGARVLAQGRHMQNCWGFFGDIIHGTKGSAVLGEGISNPKLFKTWQQKPDDIIWEHKGAASNSYQHEHDLLFDAIRTNKPYNETERCAKGALAGILGRMACESGKMVTWEEALNSNLALADVDNLKWDGPAPVMPDKDGRYPVAVPGMTKAF